MPVEHFIHVVFCDDYADSAYVEETEAEAFVTRKNAEEAARIVKMDDRRPVRTWRAETLRLYQKGEIRHEGLRGHG